MEKKICKTCGMELPINNFQTWKRKDGTFGVLHQCLRCQRKKANKRYSDKKKFGELSKFETRLLVEELRRRGINELHND